VHGVVTAPSRRNAAVDPAGIAQILAFKDDQGEPMNENARRFLVVVPVGLYLVRVAACSTLTQAALRRT
jgi:hypothetical protein